MIYLREITRTDIPLINQWRQNRTLIENLFETYRFVNQESDEAWFEQYCKSRQQQIRLAICLQETHQHIGNVYLLNINSVCRSCVFHVFIADSSAQRKGYGQMATTLALTHAFMDQNLHRVELSVLDYNQAAIALYEKCGFKQEGIAKKAAFKNGTFVDVVQMAILRDEFLEGFTPCQ